MARTRQEWLAERQRAQIQLRNESLLAGTMLARGVQVPAPTGGGTGGGGDPIVIPPGSGGGPPVITPPPDPTPTNKAPAQISLTWRAGFEGGIIPPATAIGTVIFDLAASPGTGIAFTNQSDPDGMVTLAGATGKLAATPTGSHSFTIRAENEVGATTQAYLIQRAATTPTTGNLAGTRDAAGTIPGCTWLFPTQANTGPLISTFKDPNTITTAQGGAVFRSGFIVYMRGQGATVDGYDFSGNALWEIIIDANDCTVRNCKFFAGVNSPPSTVHSDTASGTAIDFNEWRGQRSSSGSHRQWTAFFARVHHRSCVRNKVIDTPWDGFLYGGSVALISQNYFQAQGFIIGAHPDLITLNAGYPGQKRTLISYNWFDALGPEFDVRASSSCISVKDNADVRSNYLFFRNAFKGGSVQHQMSVDLISKCEFHQNVRFIISGPPIYGTIGAGGDAADDGPYGAFYTEAYGSGGGDLMIHNDIEGRTGNPSTELDGTPIARVVAGRPLAPSISACTAGGQVSFAPPGNGGSAITGYEWVIGLAGAGDLTEPAALAVAGTTTLTGQATPIANAWNHIMVRALNANGPGPWSLPFEFASASVAQSAPSFPSGVSIPSSIAQGQTITITAAATGNPTPTLSIQKQRDTAGNNTFANVGSAFSTTSYAADSSDTGNQIQFVITASNGVGSPAVATTNKVLVSAPAATISTTPTFGTFGVSALGDGSEGTLSATPGLPSGTGGKLLAFAAYSNIVTGSNTGPNALTLPANCSRVEGSQYMFFGQCGIAVYEFSVAPGSPPTFSVVDGRAGDYLQVVIGRFTGGAGIIEAVTAEYYTQTPNLNALGAGRLAVVASAQEWTSDDVSAPAVGGTAPSGYSTLVLNAQTTSGSYKPSLAIDVCNTLTVTNGNVAKAQRTFTPSDPGRSVFCFLLLR